MSGILDLSAPDTADAGADVVTGSITALNANLATGTPTAGSFVAINAADADTLAIHVTGTFVATLQIQGSLDGINWIQLANLINVNSGAVASTITAVGLFQLDVAGLSYVRITASAYTSGTAVAILSPSDNTGAVAIDGGAVTLLGGSATIGTATITPATASAFALTSAASTNATSVKSTAGTLLEVTADNFTAAIKYLKLYNKASAPTVGTDVPILTIPIPANGFISLNLGLLGKRFTTGIAYALTGAQAVADTTALAAGDVHVHGSYI